MSSDALSLAIVLAGTTAGAAVDLRTGRVPNGLTLSLASVGMAMAALGLGGVGVAGAFGGCLVGLLLMLPGHVLGATGGGDVKLLAAAGTVLGPTNTLWAFIFTMLAGAVLALVVAARRRRLALTLSRSFERVRTFGADAVARDSANAGNRFAYAPAIAVGVAAAVVFV